MPEKRGILKVVAGALGILSALLSFSCDQEKPRSLHVHLMDTDFCRERVGSVPKNITFSFAGENTLPGCSKGEGQKRRYHGSLVLKEILSHINDRPVTFHLHRVFNSSGEQTEYLWQKALALAEKGSSHLVVAAVGFPVKKKSPKLSLPKVPFVVASGNVSKGIRRTDALWPQMEAPSENLYLVGSKIPGPRGYLRDSTVLYRSQVDVFFPGESSSSILKGSSLALATAAGQLISKCREALLDNKKFKNCDVLK